ncbi:alpha-L-rhamnosidase-related protein [Deminuibacter soli]|uniref:Alpha-L-rhamnosidase n=1 Tax=Deminuibacter soli TaxID=2291815 RepID=A0A3E1NCU1_9BACT|nr:alpha-L-rhamnosidase C-terminal domain-containing protein [Deminuibacter soli]RFM25634.1 alpha-L-rhamnosidase [Deminuibacter soli]
MSFSLCTPRKIVALSAVIGCILLLHGYVHAQLPAVWNNLQSADARKPLTVTRYITPARIIKTTGNIVNAAQVLQPGTGQADLTGRNICVLRNIGPVKASLLLDFGKELQGGLQLITGMHTSGKPVRVRLRFGESVTEALSDTGGIPNATNDHAIRDEIVQLPWLGKFETGNTGFRFVNITLVDTFAELKLKEVSAMFAFQDIPYIGSFSCSDSLLNKIWRTGAYTVHLNMQDYLWDGIKRDRLVWVGDMHPEVATINAVFGDNPAVTKSLDRSRDDTPLPQWMNGISTYSMWWILIQRDWYYHNGDTVYLRKQAPYLRQLLRLLCSKTDHQNSEHLDGMRFLDWPSSQDSLAIHAGLQAMMVLSLQAGADLSRQLGDASTAAHCDATITRLKKHIPDANGSKQAAALLALSGLWPAEKANAILSKDGAQRFSTFYGYYMLQAQAMAGDYTGALNNIRSYWGGMLQMGATTFWEDFDISWMRDASRIDELPVPGKKDIHGDNGAYCYIGFRHSLCHGWASGPTPWLTQHILGIEVLEPGCRKVRIVPHLGDLQFAEGSFPTPYGIIKVKHIKQADGSVSSSIQAPEEVTVIRQ